MAEQPQHSADSEQRDPLCFWGDNPSLPCNYPHLGMVLCDDGGVVREGAMHDGTDYPCTGHAHYSGYHILCTSPAHRAKAADAWRCGERIFDEDSLRADIASVWGEFGAHIDVYDTLVRLARLGAETDREAQP